MKGRYLGCFFAVCVFLFLSSLPAYAQNAARLIEATVKHQQSKQVVKNKERLNSSDKYVVRPGDSLYKIARKFKTTPQRLMAANKLKSSRIRVGQEIFIPGATNTASATEASKSAENASPSANTLDYQIMSRLHENDQLDEESNMPRRLQLIKAGFEMLGIGYRFSGMSEESGFDCSGLVKSLFSKFNIELPRSSREQFKQGQKVEKEELQPGDLIFFSSGGKSPTHVGIYIGGNKFIHAARKARQVIISDLNKFWYTMRYLGARRITDLWEDETPTAQKPKE